MKDVTEKFRVRTGDGSELDAYTLRDRVESTHLQSESRQFQYGLKTHRLDDGRYLNYVDDDTFEIVATGEQVKRVT